MTFAMIIDELDPVVSCAVLTHALRAHRSWLGAKLVKERNNEVMRAVYTIEIERLDKMLDALCEMSPPTEDGSDLA